MTNPLPILYPIANNTRGRGRRPTKRRGGQRNGRPNRNGLAALVQKGKPSDMQRIPGLGFPSAVVCNLRYCDTYALTITTGSLGTQKMRWNSTFDPDQSGIGHQPLYRDTFATIYDHYAVVSAYVEVSFVNNAAFPILVGMVTDDDTSPSTDVHVLMEQAYGVHKLLPPQAGSLSTCVLRSDWDCKKVLKIDPFGSESYKTAVGSNPTEESILSIWATTTDGVSSSSVIVNVTLVQHVLWTELATATLS